MVEAQEWLHSEVSAGSVTEILITAWLMAFYQESTHGQPGLEHTLRSARQGVMSRAPDALPMADHLEVLCEHHAPANSLPATSIDGDVGLKTPSNFS